MSRQYEAEIFIRIADPMAMRIATMTIVRVQFNEPDDPRELLTKVALEAALEQAKTAERRIS